MSPVAVVESVLILAVMGIAFFSLPLSGFCFVLVALQGIYVDLAAASKAQWRHTFRLILAVLVFCVAAMMALWVEYQVLVLEGLAA